MAFISEKQAAEIAGLTPRGLRRKVVSGEYAIAYRVRIIKERKDGKKSSPRGYQYNTADLDKLFTYSEYEKLKTA